MASEQRVWTRRLLIAAIVAGCLLLLAIGYGLAKGRTIRVEFSRRAQILAEEFKSARPKVADQDNAAPLYRQARDALAAEEDINAIIDGTDRRREGLRAFSSDRVAKVLDANRRALELLADAADKPGCDFGNEDPIDIFSYSESRLLIAARLLTVAALHASQAGQAEQSVGFLKTRLRVALAAEGSGLPADRLLANMVLRTAAYDSMLAAEESDGVVERAPELLRAIDAVCRRRASTATVLKNYKALAVIKADRLLGPGRAENATLNPWVLLGGYVKASEACERIMDDCSAQAGEDYLQVLEELQRHQEAAGEDASNAGTIRRLFFEMARNCAQSDGGTEASVAVCRQAIGCRLFRLRFGACPERLENLAEKLPEHFREQAADPFTRKPLRYRKTATGCVIWSFGPDCTDNGGDWDKDMALEVKG